MRYLYSNPQTTYPELVVAARRAESKTEETKVKVQSAAATEVPSGSKELGDQIVWLMAALTMAEQSTRSASAPSSPRHRVMGGEGQTGKLLFTPTPTMVRPAWAKPPLASPCKGNQNVQTNVQDSTQGAQSSSSLQCYRCQGWGHMARECTTPAVPLNREGGTQGNAVKPPSNCAQ